MCLATSFELIDKKSTKYFDKLSLQCISQDHFIAQLLALLIFNHSLHIISIRFFIQPKMKNNGERERK